MAGCNEGCHCFHAVADGLDLTGDGAALTPYVTGVAAGWRIPMVGTSVQRAALDLGDLNDGVRFYETDTGMEYVVSASIWFPYTVAWVQSAIVSAALSAPADTYADFATVELTPGYWMVFGKGNIEASTPGGPVIWTAILDVAPDAVIIDTTHTSGNFEDAADHTASYARPFNLQSIFHATATPTTTVTLKVARNSTNGAQLVINPRIEAIRIPGLG